MHLPILAPNQKLPTVHHDQCSGNDADSDSREAHTRSDNGTVT